MSKVDFMNSEVSGHWFSNQPSPVTCAISSRVGLRLTSNIYQTDPSLFERAVCDVFRALITSATYGLGRAADASGLRVAAMSAAEQGFRTAELTSNASTLAAILTAARAAAMSPESAARSVSEALADSFTRPIMLHSLQIDASIPALLEAKVPIWHSLDLPLALEQNHARFLERLESHRNADYFYVWYKDMWEGNPIDWAFASKVAQIPSEVWSKGLNEIAARIGSFPLERDETKWNLQGETIELFRRLEDWKTTTCPPIDGCDVRKASREIELETEVIDAVLRELTPVKMAIQANEHKIEQLTEVSVRLRSLATDFQDAFEELASGRGQITIIIGGATFAIYSSVFQNVLLQIGTAISKISSLFEEWLTLLH